MKKNLVLAIVMAILSIICAGCAIASIVGAYCTRSDIKYCITYTIVAISYCFVTYCTIKRHIDAMIDYNYDKTTQGKEDLLEEIAEKALKKIKWCYKHHIGFIIQNKTIMDYRNEDVPHPNFLEVYSKDIVDGLTGELIFEPGSKVKIDLKNLINFDGDFATKRYYVSCFDLSGNQDMIIETYGVNEDDAIKNIDKKYLEENELEINKILF